MKLNVLERLMLQTLLPREGNFANLKLIRVAKEALSFNEEELKHLNIRETGEGADRKMLWNDGLPDKEITLGETATTMVEKALKEKDEKGQLTDELISLYEKFIENKRKETLQ